jgi:hypothetical protein
MKCYTCGKDKNYFTELQPIPITGKEAIAQLPRRVVRMICHTCLDWDKKDKK